MGVKQNTAEVRHRQPVGLGSRKISTATVGETSRSPQLSATLSLRERTSCRYGGVRLSSIASTLLLSLDRMPLTYANVSRASSEAVPL